MVQVAAISIYKIQESKRWLRNFIFIGGVFNKITRLTEKILDRHHTSSNLITGCFFSLNGAARIIRIEKFSLQLLSLL